MDHEVDESGAIVGGVDREVGVDGVSCGVRDINPRRTVICPAPHLLHLPRKLLRM